MLHQVDIAPDNLEALVGHTADDIVGWPHAIRLPVVSLCWKSDDSHVVNDAEEDQNAGSGNGLE